MEGVPIRAVSRTIAILQVINTHAPMPVMDIARFGKLPYPTVFRIVQTLVHAGLVEQDPQTKAYRPTAQVETLAHGYQDDNGLAAAAQPLMRELTARLGWPMFVATRAQARMIVRGSTHAQSVMTFDLCNPGVTIPLLTSASGQVYMAGLADAELAPILEWATRNAWRRDTAREREAFLTRLEHVRREGHAGAPCSALKVHRTASIAVPVHADGKSLAALTLTYFLEAMDADEAIVRYAGELKDAAARLGERLSCRAVAA